MCANKIYVILNLTSGKGSTCKDINDHTQDLCDTETEVKLMEADPRKILP